MWGFATRSNRSVEDTPKHEELFRDADDAAEAVTRETSQNSADAKSSSSAKVRMRFARAELPRKKFEADWAQGLREHMDAWRPGYSDKAFDGDKVQCLVIEDFGTRGLWGDLNKEGGAFYAFWRQYGASPKGGNTGGRHGVGKSTLAGASRARAFFGLTVREDDEKKLLMGQTILGPHQIGSTKYEAYGEYSPTEGDEMPAPFEGKRATKFAADFGLSRVDEPGLSLVVPAVRPEIIADELEAVKRAVVANCFPQIAAGLLEFDIAGETLDRDNIAAWATRWPDLKLEGAVALALAATSDPEFVEAAEKPDIGEASFTTEQIEKLRADFQAGEVVAVRAPITVPLAGGGAKAEDVGHLRLFLRKTGGKTPPSEHYARSRLTVPKQTKVLRGSEVNGLLVAEDGPLSDFLGDAEPPSHARWTATNLADKGKYPRAKAQAALPRVAQALRQLERLLLNEDAEVESKDAFKSMFSRPKPPEKKKKDPIDGEKKIDIPPARPFWKVVKRPGGFELLRPSDDVPTDVEVEVAYARRRASANWRSTDFDLSAGGVVVSSEGDGEFDAAANKIRINAAAEGFRLTAEGFDVNRDIVVVVKAAGDADAED